MSRPLGVPNLAIGADAGHLGLVPIDVARKQLAQTETGVGRSFVNVTPYAGLAILSPFKSRATIDKREATALQGNTSSLPFRIGGK
jgi:hypothetical protein